MTFLSPPLSSLDREGFPDGGRVAGSQRPDQAPHPARPGLSSHPCSMSPSPSRPITLPPPSLTYSRSPISCFLLSLAWMTCALFAERKLQVGNQNTSQRGEGAAAERRPHNEVSSDRAQAGPTARAVWPHIHPGNGLRGCPGWAPPQRPRVWLWLLSLGMWQRRGGSWRCRCPRALAACQSPPGFCGAKRTET